ncbi:peptidase M48 [Rhodobacteraceae bacterium CCMM004]|nr:peptidase M48 [Rhodobacteraceae bacterium CCMM004]
MRLFVVLCLVLTAAACVAVPPPAPPGGPGPVDRRAGSAEAAVRTFVAVVRRVEPEAERVCRARTAGTNCDFHVVVDDRPGLPPNAFQTLDRSGRPVIGFTSALILTAQNADEMAFILGHEAAHHIAGHIPRAQRSAAVGAVLAGTLAGLQGADATVIREAESLGAFVGVRRFSRQFELEADALGTVIAAGAGFDPVRGAAFFARIPDPGDRFLGSHPPNAERIALVRRVAAGL